MLETDKTYILSFVSDNFTIAKKEMHSKTIKSGRDRVHVLSVSNGFFSRKKADLTDQVSI